MTVHSNYPPLAALVRKFGYRLGTGMNQIVGGDDEDERGFNGPDGSQVMLNRRTGTWEHASEDGKRVRNGRTAARLESILEKEMSCRNRSSR